MGSNADTTKSGSEEEFVQGAATTPVAGPSSAAKAKGSAKSGGKKGARKAGQKDGSLLANDGQGSSDKVSIKDKYPHINLVLRELRRSLESMGDYDMEEIDRRIELFKVENDIESDGDDSAEEPAMKTHTDGNGFSFCLKHRRDVYRDCFQNHSVGNNAKRATLAMQLGDEGPMKASLRRVLDQHRDVQESLVLSGLQSDSEQPTMLTTHLRNAYEELSHVEEKPIKNFAHCGRVDDLKMCRRCKSTWYCSKEHQLADHRNHLAFCLPTAEVANSTGPPLDNGNVEVVSWKYLQKMHPLRATGKTLEVLILTKPYPVSLLGLACDGRDAEDGWVRQIGCSRHRPRPQGLRKGCVLCCRNPVYSPRLKGLPGGAGAFIRDEALGRWFRDCSVVVFHSSV